MRPHIQKGKMKGGNPNVFNNAVTDHLPVCLAVRGADTGHGGDLCLVNPLNFRPVHELRSQEALQESPGRRRQGSWVPRRNNNEKNK